MLYWIIYALLELGTCGNVVFGIFLTFRNLMLWFEASWSKILPQQSPNSDRRILLSLLTVRAKSLIVRRQVKPDWALAGLFIKPNLTPTILFSDWRETILFPLSILVSFYNIPFDFKSFSEIDMELVLFLKILGFWRFLPILILHLLQVLLVDTFNLGLLGFILSFQSQQSPHEGFRVISCLSIYRLILLYFSGAFDPGLAQSWDAFRPLCIFELLIIEEVKVV